MSSFVAQNFISQLFSAQVGYQTSTYYPSYSYSPPPANGYAKNAYIIGTTNGTTSMAWSDIRSLYLNSLNVSNPWINDPAGAVWDEDCGFWRAWMITTPEYGIPLTTDDATVWTEVISADLLIWTYNSTPFLSQYNFMGAMWGGSVIIDTENTAGLGAGTVFYFVSSPGPDGVYVTQTISRWCAPALGYPPVLEGCILAPPLGYPRRGGSGFRDSRVFWDSDRKEWIMGMTIDYGLCFYTSPDLNNWTFQWVEDLNTWNQIECPNLFMMMAQDGTKKWIMMCSMKGDGIHTDPTTGAGNINGANQAIGYLVGQWDGTKFIRDPEYADTTVMPRRMSQGPDWYAQAPFWKDYTGTELYIWAWIGNWAYSGSLPFQGYMGVQSMVTRMLLNDQGDGKGYRIFNEMVPGQEYLYPKVLQDNFQVLTIPAGATTQTLPLKGEEITYTLPGQTTPTTTYILPPAWRLDFSICRSDMYYYNGVQAPPDEFALYFCASLDKKTYTKFSLNFTNMTWTFDRSVSGVRQNANSDGTGGNNTLLAGGPAGARAQAMYDAISTGPIDGLTNDVVIVCDGGFVEILMNGDVYICACLFPPEKACTGYYQITGPVNSSIELNFTRIRW